MNISKEITKIYPASKGLKVIELLYSATNNNAIDFITNKGQYERTLPEDSTIDVDLTNAELNGLYEILFNEKVSNISEVKTKLKLDTNGKLIDSQAKERFEEIKNDIVQTIKLYRSTIMPTVQLFERFAIKSVDDKRVKQLTQYLRTFVDINEDTVRERYIEASKNREMYNQIDKTVDNATQVIQKGRYIIRDEKSNCDIYIITLKLDDIPYATSIIYYNKDNRNDNNEKYVTIEGNSLYPIPTLAKLLFPEYSSKMPQVDDLMYSTIDEIAKELDVKVIYTSNKKEIANITNYGFTSTDYEWKISCNISVLPLKRKYVKHLNDKAKEKDKETIKYRVVFVYSITKARQFLKYQVGYGRLKDDLTDEELINLYRDLYSEEPKSIQVARNKLKIDKEGKLLDLDAKTRFDKIFKRTENTKTEIGLIDKSELPFRRFHIEGENEDNVRSITQYLSDFTQISESQVRKVYTDVNPRMIALINYEVEKSKSTLLSNRYMLENEDSNCIIIRFTAYYHRTPYASALVTYRKELKNDKGEEYVVIEDMTKYPIPILIEMLFPIFLMPDVNEILLPKIFEVVQKLNVNLIYTQELDKNRVKERYGFVETNYKWKETCNSVSIVLGTRYMKYMNREDSILSYTTVNIYPILKANKFLKYRGSQGGVKSVLSGEESIELYGILYGNESKVNKDKLKIDRREFQDEETKLRFNDIMNRIGDTEQEIMSINKSELPFRRIGFRDTNIDKMEALARYLSTSSDEVINRYKKVDTDTRSLIESHTKDAASLLYSDAKILEAEDSDCVIFRVTSYYRNSPYASALVTYRQGLTNDENEEYVVIENMTKYPIPILAETLFPEYPMLDIIESLLSKIEDITRELGVNVIYVDVPEKLNNEHGFVATNYQWDKTYNRSVINIGYKYMKRLGTPKAIHKYTIYVTLAPILTEYKKENFFTDMIIPTFQRFEKDKTIDQMFKDEKDNNFKASCDAKRKFIGDLLISTELTKIKYNKTYLGYSHDTIYFIKHMITKREEFDKILCIQNLAFKHNLTFEIISYQKFKTRDRGIIVMKYMSGLTLLNYGKIANAKILNVYLSIMKKILYQSLVLNILHKNLDVYNVFVTEDDTYIIDYPDSEIISMDNENLPYIEYDWSSFTYNLLEYLIYTNKKGIYQVIIDKLIESKLDQEEKWASIIASFYLQHNRAPTYLEVYQVVESLLL